jgi:hypothetical protein
VFEDQLSSGTRCGDYYLMPQWLTTLIRWKILDSVVDVVSEALSMHMAPLAIQTVVVPAGVGSSLPDFTIAPCVDSLLCYMLIRRPMSILQDSPKI